MTSPPDLSFEVFPPQETTGDDTFLQGVETLRAQRPLFISLTYGAGGSKRDRSQRLMDQLLARNPEGLAAHLASAGHTREEVDALARGWWARGLRHIVAIRGDAPLQAPGVGATDGDNEADREYACGAALTAGLRQVAPFEISVAGYPEGHPKSPSPQAEMEHLKRKAAYGAVRVITQFFFEPDLFLRFRERCARAGVDCPIAPGLLPVRSIRQVQRFAAGCGASVPGWLARRFEPLENDPAGASAAAVETLAALIETLQREGVTHVHLYTLNRISVMTALCRALGRPPAA